MRGRYIRPNHSSRTPGSFIAFDTETRAIDGKVKGSVLNAMRCVCAVHWRREGGRVRSRSEYVGYHGGQFWKWVESVLSTHRCTWIWAHNLGFDLTVSRFWEEWDSGRFVPKFKCLDDPPVIIKGLLNGKSIVLCDTYNWFRTSIMELGSWLKMPKLSMPAYDASMDDWIRYCWRDVEIVEAVVNQLVDLVKGEDLGVLRYTAAGQAFRHWRHMPESTMPLVPNHIRESKLARDGYYSGRAELFYRGKVDKPVYVLDVNGMYASAFMQAKQPIRLIDYSDNLSLTDLAQYVADDSCAATVELTTSHPYPYRMQNVGTLWPVGHYATTLVGCELSDAINRGVVRKVLRAAHYDLGYVGKAFCEYWWKKRLDYRQAGLTVLEKWAKGMPCYLYGKFGQTASEWVKDDDYVTNNRFTSYTRYEYDSQTIYPGRVIAGAAEYDRSRPADSGGAGGYGYDRYINHNPGRKETEWSFPAIAAWVTATARSIMDKYREIAGRRNVYYQVYDCLHCTQEGYDNLRNAGVVGQDIGQLKLKLPILSNAEYIGINLLREDGVMKASGLPSKHREIQPDRFEAITFERLGSILSRRPDGTVVISRMTWCPDRRYAHSIVGPDGWCVPIGINTT